MRIQPYTSGFKELHDGTLDIPDRLFCSLKDTVNHIMQEPSDLREIIPEFFCFPEFLKNLNQLQLGTN